MEFNVTEFKRKEQEEGIPRRFAFCLLAELLLTPLRRIFHTPAP